MRSVMRWAIAICVLALGMCAYTASAQNLDIWCVSAGDEVPGTGTVIRGPNGAVVLFDEGSGATWAGVCDALLEGEGITVIDHALASHYDSNHIGGLDNLTTSIAQCWDRGGTQDQDGNPIDATYMATVSGKRNTVTVDGNSDIDLGSGAVLRFLSVGAVDTDEYATIRGGGTVTVYTENAKSITALVTYCGFDFYVGGDADGTIEKAVDDVVITTLGRDVDVLHTDHHGSDSYDTNSVEFLANMNPEACITDGCPSETVMDRIDAVVDPDEYSNIMISCAPPTPPQTSPPRCVTNDSVHFTTDGASYSVFSYGCSINDHTTDEHPWPMFRHDIRRTGRITQTGPASPYLKWSYRMGDDVDSSAAITASGEVYIGSDDNKVYALTAAGAIKWTYMTGDDVFSSPALDASGTVYVGSGDSAVYALDTNGSLKWSYITGGAVDSSPGITEDLVYVGGSDNNIYVLTSDGALVWSYLQGEDETSSPATNATGEVYIGAFDNRLYAYTSVGVLYWSYLTEGDVFSSPAIDASGGVYVGSGDSNLYAFTYVGALSWSYLTGGALESSPAIGATGGVYIGGSDNNIYALTSAGALAWSCLQSDSEPSSPAVDVDERVYIGSLDSIIYAYNSDGAFSWSYLTGEGVFSSPAIGYQRVGVGSRDNNLYVLADPTNTPTSTPTVTPTPTETPTPTPT